MNLHRHDLFREPVLRRAPIDSSERYVTAGIRPPARPVPNPVQQVRPRQLWRTIIVTRNAEAVASANPDAFVVDHEHRRIWIGDQWCGFSTRGAATLGFRLCASVCCATSGTITHADIIEALWGDDCTGGPEMPSEVIKVSLFNAKPFLRWAGLSYRSRHSYRSITIERIARSQALPAHFHNLSMGRIALPPVPSMDAVEIDRARRMARRGATADAIARGLGARVFDVRYFCHEDLTVVSRRSRQLAVLAAWDAASGANERRRLATEYGYGNLASLRMYVGRIRACQESGARA